MHKRSLFGLSISTRLQTNSQAKTIGNRGFLSFWKISWLCLLFASTTHAATQLRFVDTNNSPVPDVVVSLASSEPFTPDETPVVVDQINRMFDPHISVIRAGQKVDFPNSDNIRHHVYSFSQSNPFEIKLYKNRPSSPITFKNSGIVTLGCNVHDDMLGFIYVASENEKVYQSDADGRVTIDSTEQIRYWHPRLSAASTEVNVFQIPNDAAEQVVRLSLTPLPDKAPVKTFGSKKFGQ